MLMLDSMIRFDERVGRNFLGFYHESITKSLRGDSEITEAKKWRGLDTFDNRFTVLIRTRV